MLASGADVLTGFDAASTTVTRSVAHLLCRQNEGARHTAMTSRIF